MLSQQRDCTRAISRWAGLWRTPDLTQHVRISFSCRLRKALGRVRPQSGIITLNANLASRPRSLLLEVLWHDAAHVAAYLLHGSRAKPHGPEWRTLVRAAGYQASAVLNCRSLPQSPPSRSSSRRRHSWCPVCQTDYFTGRRNSHSFAAPAFALGSLWLHDGSHPRRSRDVRRLFVLQPKPRAPHLETDSLIGLWDRFPVSPGHALVIPNQQGKGGCNFH
jgi:predicted SprT family Zn-dependent metalloprotease